ncbi:MAG: AIPR family protein [Nitrospirae bacterium]|nr:AIPR family protein [Nitrospirota bacterium]
MDNISISAAIDMLQKKMEHLSEEVPEYTDDIHKLFDYFVGVHFEGVQPDALAVCDQAKDQKIDLYHQTENRFVVYQCKCPDLSLLENGKKIQTYGNNEVNEIEDVLTFLTDDNGNAKGNSCSQSARTRYRRLREQSTNDFKLEVVLAIFGKLTQPAKDKFKELKSTWESESIIIKVIDYDDIVRELFLTSQILKEIPKKVKIGFDPDMIAHDNQLCYAVVSAKQFVELFEEHSMGLFDSNVRYYLDRSSINRKIIETLETNRGRKNFHLLNNGLSVTCAGWKFDETRKAIDLTNPQIINGCQTVISMHKAYYGFDEKEKNQHFDEKCFIQVRIINTNDSDLVSEIVISSNNQNKMEPRNLLSNTKIQKLHQNQFNSLSPKWFYQRKDGEFESLKKFAHKHFKIKNYESSNRKHRIIDNEDLAKAWLSFIGGSKDASEKIQAFESIDDGGRYEWLFERVPNKNHWEKIANPASISFSDDNFDRVPPSAEQYLLANLISEYIKCRIPSPFANRKACITILTDNGEINDKTPAEEINTKLMAYNEYVINSVLSNMKEVLVELYSFILVKKYGPLTPQIAKQLMQLPNLKQLLANPDLKTFVSSTELNDDLKSSENMLFAIFEFIRDSVERWYIDYKNQYLSAQRRIRYLHKEDTIKDIKSYLIKTNENTKKFPYAWKPPMVEFFECLPDIEKGKGKGAS